MRYKRLHSRIKGSQSDFDQLANAFEAEGQTVVRSFVPEINRPTSDYADKIAHIRQIDEKLGRTFQRLNRHQRHAVFFHSERTILSAMVGSGKTTVLIAKLFYLHFIQQVPFEQMVVLTFTNKAAREIKERIGSFLGEMDAAMNKQLRYFGTFHAIARQLLHEHPSLAELGFKPDFGIMDEEEKQEFLDRIVTQENLSIKYQNQLAKRWRKFRQNGETQMGNMKSEDDFVRLVELAEAEKRRSNSMDFDDLITLCNQLLEKAVPNCPKWIIVDEFQDCSEEQLQLIERLRGENTKLFVVGDQNQSIYGWRGSKERLFQEIQSEWQADWMELPQNYRSTETILSAAGNLLYEQDGSLVATRQSGKPIALVRHFDDQQEAYYLREQMLSLQQEGQSLDSVAILFRTHQQIKLVETVLSQADIPFQLVARKELHENPAQAFFLRLLKLCANSNDMDACLALVCDSTFGALTKNRPLIQQLHERAPGETVLQELVAYLEQRKKQTPDLLQLLHQVVNFETIFLRKEGASTEDLIDFLALRSVLKPTSIHHADYLASITEAWNQLQLFMKKTGWGDSASSFRVALDQVVLEGTFQINERIKEQGQGVHLLTIHASKGLEFDRVYIAGANTGIIPLAQHNNGSLNVKEEKRLLFVAMTRGKNVVEIGWHAQPTLRNAEPKPSYFLNAIPDSLLDRRESAATSVAEVTEQLAEEWPIGCRVSHKKYGLGEVVLVEEKDLLCRFDSVGEKSFSKAFAKALLTIEN
ncbi:ATP-dependent helicase [Mangrovibacterium diazotrophicum]|uniref:DNA 3'-5' helicase n=1 Tax=Mangrovibacterium diazotrophicum TaxID=1261403 RepID=A0A419VWJ7_9BACT|nr:ATP-dependent helicase [Mangrovibacterium diazotrophicum]RKD86523.1 DNA helicase-2/ATP-dependent DNA helicase PcrA [Mangrovibacterium diazotrophicum]